MTNVALHKITNGYDHRQILRALHEADATDDVVLQRSAREVAIQFLRYQVTFRALPWYRRAWLTLTGKAPR